MPNTPIFSDSSLRDAFLTGAARAFFVSAYVDFVEDSNRKGYPRPGPREDWMDFAPPTPLNAYVLAGELWCSIEALNHKSMHVIFQLASKADGVELDANDFGHYMAMEAMGHGVSWFDDHGRFDLKVPSMDVGQFSFDEDAYKARRRSR